MRLLPEPQVDVHFQACPPLAPLPCYIYALLRSPLLASAAQTHPDLAAYLQHLWTCLPAGELSRAVRGPGGECCVRAGLQRLWTCLLPGKLSGVVSGML